MLNVKRAPALRWAMATVVLVFVSAQAGSAFAADEEIRILRDEYGIPHIFAETPEGACYGMGYAQSEDRLEELLTQYRRATGTMSEAFGKQYFRDDWRQRVWQHAFIAKEKYHTLSARTRGMIEAYIAGVKQYMQEHPDKVPAWAPQPEPWMCVALGRYIIWGWPEGEAGGDMQRGGIEPDPVGYHGSNEWLLAPSKTKDKVPMALIDPHLSWYGAFRFYEARMYGGDLAFSGMAIVGNPVPTLGHSRYCSIAMTTGGPDTSDCYEETISPDNPRRYQYDGQFRDMTVRRDVIRVKDGDKVKDVPVEIEYTHHGPVVARRGNKAYTLSIPYFDQVTLADQSIQMAFARNLGEMKQALSMLQLMEQNVMIGTVQGDIYYLRNGRVPIRAPGFDYHRPLAGNTSQTEWRGIYRLEDLVQLQNPPSGYMQNCNVSPQFMLKNSPLTPDKWADRPWLFNGFTGDVQNRDDNPLHQRAAMCLELVDKAGNVTVDQGIGIATSYGVYGADVWQKMLAGAWESAPADYRKNEQNTRMYELISHWDRRNAPDSTAAIAYKYWKDQLGPEVQLNDRAGFPPPKGITSEMLLKSLEQGAAKLIADHGRLDIPFGEVYRVGRRGSKRTFPVGGGSIDGIATPRAIGFDPIEGTKQFVGRGGQTSTQIVLLTDPPQSWTVLPLGESDDAQSVHYDDQAEKLFSQARMKSTYFLNRPELDKHVVSNKTLHRARAEQ